MRLVDRGLTQVGLMEHTQAISQGLGAATDCLVWYVAGNTRDRGLQEVFEDLDAVVLPPKPGLKPVAYAFGWSLTAPSGAKQPEERWPLMR